MLVSVWVVFILTIFGSIKSLFSSSKLVLFLDFFCSWRIYWLVTLVFHREFSLKVFNLIFSFVSYIKISKKTKLIHPENPNNIKDIFEKSRIFSKEFKFVYIILSLLVLRWVLWVQWRIRTSKTADSQHLGWRYLLLTQCLWWDHVFWILRPWQIAVFTLSKMSQIKMKLLFYVLHIQQQHK